MSFHTLDYLLFVPIVVVLYFQTPQRFRWVVLLGVSNLFYANWRLEFLPLLWLTTVIDYLVARAMPRVVDKRARLGLLAVSLTSNLGMLLFFKYFALLANTWAGLAHRAGEPLLEPISILLPLGISFYTFQTLGYVIDVFRGRREPERHLGYFAVYVMYFPQLIAGPIERPGRILPQLRQEHVFDVRRAAAGGAIMLIGFFKKLVIADNLAWVVPSVLTHPTENSPLVVTMASFASIYRFYADLSGYADIAIGTSLIIGIRLTQNFNRPFAAVSISEFWQRWHVTVTNWFRDYVYIPFARRGREAWRRPAATFVTMVIIAVWHGAAWTWLAAGVVAGAVMIVEGQIRRNQAAARTANAVFGMVGMGPRQIRLVQDNANRLVLWVFLIFLGAMVNAPGWREASEIWRRMSALPAQLLALNLDLTGISFLPKVVLVAIVGLEIYQWFDSRRPVFERLADKGLPVAWAFYYGVIAAILMFGTFDYPDFIYFRI